MLTNHRATVVAVFEDRTHAQEAVRELRSRSFSETEIGVASRRGETLTSATSGGGGNVALGAGVGGALGAGAGALWALGLAAGVLPAIVPVIAGGLLASILASAAGTAAVGGLVGALVGLGLPEREARFYDQESVAGRTIVTVCSQGRSGEAAEILRRHGSHDMSSRLETTGARVTTPVL